MEMVEGPWCCDETGPGCAPRVEHRSIQRGERALWIIRNADGACGIMTQADNFARLDRFEAIDLCSCSIGPFPTEEAAMLAAAVVLG